MTCGIYQIALNDGRCYVGQSVDIEKRWRQHRRELNVNNHHSPYLQRAWNKYGEEIFSFSVLEVVDPPTLLFDDLRVLLTEREQWWVDNSHAVFNYKKPSERGVFVLPKEALAKLSAINIAKAVERSGSLSEGCPGVAAEWHPTLNVLLTAVDVAPGSQKRIWWLCSMCGLEWIAAVRDRTKNGTGCPACSSSPKVVSDRNRLSLVRPDVALDWHPTLNGALMPTDVMANSAKRAWWLCRKCSYEWESKISNRAGANSRGCPQCAKNNLAPRSEESRLRSSIAVRKAWLEHGESWRDSGNMKPPPHNGQGGHGRPVGWGLSDANRLSIQYPLVASQWHLTKNGEVAPDGISAGSDFRAWWICACCGHEWRASISSRCKGNHGCPSCAHQLIGNHNAKPKPGNSLSERCPDLLTQWDYAKNSDSPESFSWGSGKKAWWLCPDCGHSWQAVISTRAKRGYGCPSCAGRAQRQGNFSSKLSPQEVLEIEHLGSLGELTHKAIAERFNVTAGTVGHIMSGRQWVSVTGRTFTPTSSAA